MCYWEHKKMLRADVSTQEQYYIKDRCVTGSTRQFWGPMCQPIVLHAKEEAGAFNGVSYAASGASVGAHPNCKPRTTGTREISSPICVSVHREVARTVCGTGPTYTWSSGRIMPSDLDYVHVPGVRKYNNGVICKQFLWLTETSHNALQFLAMWCFMKPHELYNFKLIQI